MQVCSSGHSLPDTQISNSSQSGQGTPDAAAGKLKIIMKLSSRRQWFRWFEVLDLSKFLPNKFNGHLHNLYVHSVSWFPLTFEDDEIVLHRSHFDIIILIVCPRRKKVFKTTIGCKLCHQRTEVKTPQATGNLLWVLENIWIHSTRHQSSISTTVTAMS